MTPTSDKTTRYLYYAIVFVLICHFIALIVTQYYMKANAILPKAAGMVSFFHKRILL